MISKTKRILLVLWGMSIFLGTFSFAQQDTGMINTGIDTIDVNLSNDSVKKSLGDINQVKAFFCNGDEITDTIFLSVVPGEEKNLCIRFENNNDDPIVFLSDFFETETTMSGYPSCNAGNPVNLFNKSITNDRGNMTKVPAKSYVQKNINLKFPIGYSGLYHFCHYYKIDNSNASVPMFNIVVHKQSFMDIYINTENVQLSGSVSISDLQRSGENLSFSMKNIFPFDQEVSFEATISNTFGFSKEIVLNSEIIRYNTSRLFTVNIKDLPYYKGPFNLDIKVKYKPRFDFDPKNSGMDQKILDGGEMSQKLSFFIFDKVQLIMLAVLFILIFLIKMAFFTKPKVVYVDQGDTKKEANKTL